MLSDPMLGGSHSRCVLARRRASLHRTITSMAFDEGTHTPYGKTHRRCREHVARSPSSELAPVSPRREFRTQRTANAYQLETFGQSGQPDVRGLCAQPEPAKAPFALLHCLPPLFEWSEIPALAVRTDHPQPTLGRIEREPFPDGKRLDDLIASEILTTMNTRAVHGQCVAAVPRLIAYASMIVPYFTSMFGTSHSGSLPARRKRRKSDVTCAKCDSWPTSYFAGTSTAK